MKIRKAWQSLIETIFGDLLVGTNEFPVDFCPICHRGMTTVPAEAACNARMCPKGHAAIIALFGADVRNSLPLIEVSKDIRAMPLSRRL